jgi:tetratricopeptide (TPR) repeat protein
MWKPIFLLAFLLLAQLSVSGQTISSIFSCQGKNYSLKFTDEDLADSPTWDWRSRKAQPLSGDQAAEAARKTLSECHPDADDNWQLSSSVLIPMGINRWVYVVKFKCPHADCTKDKNVCGFYVRLDGKVVRPAPGAEHIEIPASFEFGQNLEKRDCRARFFLCSTGEYTALIAANPKNVVAYFNRGRAYQVEKKYDNAIADFSKVIQLEPQFPQIYANRGVAYSVIKSYDLAIADFDKDIGLDPKSANGYYGRGVAYHSKGDLKKAFSDFDRAIELAPNEWLYRYVRGWLHYRNGSNALAKEDFRKALELALMEENVSTVQSIGPTYPEIP